ncbi:TPA: argininosuccinate lyase [bacterium]|nr:argininosuccinate lyase [bacterium]
MTKLWEKGYELNREIECFTVGEDYLLDQALVKADAIGTLAHAKTLEQAGILNSYEVESLKKVLLKILKEDITITPEEEDVHTAIENYLTKELGELGKNIHTARSRNDQILIDLRLYSKERLFEVEETLLESCRKLYSLAQRHRDIPMPGRTHFRVAMPSSVGLWAGAFLESLLDDLILLESAYSLNNQSPLGSAAGYGVSLNIDRKFTAGLLGFAKVQNNVLYASNSRGKIEAVILSALSQVMIDLSKLATDLIIFTAPEFGYFELPKELCPGSSIMPQKYNPAALEILRAKTNVVISYLFEVLNIISSLPSGYNQDFQETKGPLMRGFEITLASLKVAGLVISNLKVNEESLLRGFSDDIFAADEALRLVRQGMTFRDAYQEVAKHLERLEASDPKENILSKTHLGAPGNLGLEVTKERMDEAASKLKKQKEVYLNAISSLLGAPYEI